MDWSRFTLKAIRPIGAAIISTYDGADVSKALLTAQHLADKERTARQVADDVVPPVGSAPPSILCPWDKGLDWSRFTLKAQGRAERSAPAALAGAVTAPPRSRGATWRPGRTL